MTQAPKDGFQKVIDNDVIVGGNHRIYSVPQKPWHL